MADPVHGRQVVAGRTVRIAYAILMIGLGLTLGWLIVRHVIYVGSDGKVVAPEHIISTPYNARIVSIYVKPGQRVAVGERLAKVRSPEIYGLRSHLAASLAANIKQEGELRMKLTVATEVLPFAVRRFDFSKDVLENIDENCNVASPSCAAAYVEHYDALKALVELRSEQRQIELDLPSLKAEREKISENQKAVDEAFNEGDQISPIDGIIGPEIASQGQSVVSGQPILTVMDSSSIYIEWILDDTHLRHPRVGDPVYVVSGMRVMRGKVADMLDVASRSPTIGSVFSNARFGQVVQVRLFDGEAPPPLMSVVEVRYNYWRFMDEVVEGYVRIMDGLGLWQVE